MKALKLILISALLPLSGYGAAGLFDQFIIVNTGGNTYYDIGPATANQDFQAANLGSFTNMNSLLLGGQGKSFKNNSSDVTGMQLFYRVWQGSASGAFSQLNYAFQINNVGGVGGDQQWGTDVAGSNGTAFYTGNLLSGRALGTYNLEVYSRITTNGTNAATEIFNNASNSNFTATFTVVPEPSRAVLAFLGGLCVFFRRRR